MIEILGDSYKELEIKTAAKDSVPESNIKPFSMVEDAIRSYEAPNRIFNSS